MNDWNNNEKKDMQDNLIEYSIYIKFSDKSGSTLRCQVSGTTSKIWTILCLIVVLLVLGWITDLVEPKPTYSGYGYSSEGRSNHLGDYDRYSSTIAPTSTNSESNNS